MNTWVQIPQNSDFTIYNIPFGIFSNNNSNRRVGIAIGDAVLDLVLTAKSGVFKDLNFDPSVFEANT